MPAECVFDHLSNNARRFHEFYKNWDQWEVAGVRDDLARQLREYISADVKSKAKRKPLQSAYYFSMMLFKFAREIERHQLERGEVV